MTGGAIAILLGVLALLQLPALPDTVWVQFLPLALLLAAFPSPWRLPALFAAGFLWALFRAALILSAALPAGLEGRDLQVQGVVATVPAAREWGRRFELQIESLSWEGEPRAGPHRVRLSWYRPPPELGVGQRWSLTVRLKRPHGFHNPGGFDYEGWLFQRGIQATGYVRERGDNRLLGQARGYGLQRLREHLAAHIDGAAAGYAHAGIVTALAVGLRDRLTQEEWGVLRATGTAHLMAISGLHIGLVAGLAFFIGRRLWSLSATAVLRVPAPVVGAWTAILVATLYAALAGFSVPTQRALVMVVALLGAMLLRRHTSPRHTLSLALLVILILEPLSALSAGFWLSFGAVAAILLGMSGRLLTQGPWWRWGRVHWVVAVGLFPLMAAFFGENPLLAPLANLVAVPLVGLVVVPLALGGTLLSLVWAPLGQWLLRGAAIGLGHLWPFLEVLAHTPLVHRTSWTGSPWSLGAAGLGVFLLLLPRGLPGRWLGLIWLAPMVFAAHPRPPPGEAWLTLLDVGQGLAAVVRTEGHVLVYDTGPRFSERFDTGRAVIEPFLRRQGIGHLDTLIVSHGDNDHAGGADSLLARMPVGAVLSSVPERWSQGRPCRRGQSWDWDGVSFQILYPGDSGQGKDNDRSCVLKVVSRSDSFLLPGDVEADVEAELVSRYGRALAADVLVVPHHGSRTSSSGDFLDTVRPRVALFPVGYRNRFGFPAREVLARYRLRAIETHDTARGGALQVRVPEGKLEIRSHRREHRRFWQAPPA
jgi:competence protein ComEC